MTKLQFRRSIEIINFLRNKDNDFSNKLQSAFDVDTTIMGVPFVWDAIDQWIDWLEDVHNDNNQWISYWIYDCDCGKTEHTVSDENGTRVMTFDVLCELLEIVD